VYVHILQRSCRERRRQGGREGRVVGGPGRRHRSEGVKKEGAGGESEERADDGREGERRGKGRKEGKQAGRREGEAEGRVAGRLRKDWKGRTGRWGRAEHGGRKGRGKRGREGGGWEIKILDGGSEVEREGWIRNAS